MMVLPRKTVDYVEGESMTAFTMRRVESEVWNKAMDVAQEEIDRLNAQVAMLRHYAAWVNGLVENWSADEIMYSEIIMSGTESDWLTLHDKQIRDGALEEAIRKCIEFGDTCSEIGKINLGDCFAEEIRAMKAKL